MAFFDISTGEKSEIYYFYATMNRWRIYTINNNILDPVDSVSTHRFTLYNFFLL